MGFRVRVLKGYRMLKKLHLKNLTVFPEAELAFGKNLNVIVGENGTGKTHILKACYAPLEVIAKNSKKLIPPGFLQKQFLQTALTSKLIGVFRPDKIGSLTRLQASDKDSCVLDYSFAQQEFNIQFSFNKLAEYIENIDKMPTILSEELPVYLPTRELLTIYPGFVSVYETTQLSFEETWRDICILLGAPLAKGPREAKIKKLLKPIEEAMDGSIDLDKSGRFYLNTKNGRMEMDLVAEGLRKLAMIARLIATGSLIDKGYLFWDEPEANLNPRIIKLIAKTILHLCKSGIQVFIATHSLFLMRELHILQQSEFKDLDSKYFGLHFQDGGVEVQQGPTMDDIGDISALDEELMQSNRYIDLEQNQK
jgi:AAA15 family ATPase/GTPase